MDAQEGSVGGREGERKEGEKSKEIIIQRDATVQEERWMLRVSRSRAWLLINENTFLLQKQGDAWGEVMKEVASPSSYFLTNPKPSRCISALIVHLVCARHCDKSFACVHEIGNSKK